MGRIATTQINLDPGEIRNEHINQSTNIDETKLRHLYKAGTNFGLALSGTPVDREELVFVASTTGTVRGFHVMLSVTGTTTDIDFILKKNGTTVLSAPVNFVDGDSNGTVKDGTISVPSFSAGDRFTIELDQTENTGAQGPFAWAEFVETVA